MQIFEVFFSFHFFSQKESRGHALEGMPRLNCMFVGRVYGDALLNRWNMELKNLQIL
jgi:hypothetical protein